MDALGQAELERDFIVPRKRNSSFHVTSAVHGIQSDFLQVLSPPKTLKPLKIVHQNFPAYDELDNEAEEERSALTRCFKGYDSFDEPFSNKQELVEDCSLNFIERGKSELGQNEETTKGFPEPSSADDSSCRYWGFEGTENSPCSTLESQDCCTRNCQGGHSGLDTPVQGLCKIHGEICPRATRSQTCSSSHFEFHQRIREGILEDAEILERFTRPGHYQNLPSLTNPPKKRLRNDDSPTSPVDKMDPMFSFPGTKLHFPKFSPRIDSILDNSSCSEIYEEEEAVKDEEVPEDYFASKENLIPESSTSGLLDSPVKSCRRDTSDTMKRAKSMPNLTARFLDFANYGIPVNDYREFEGQSISQSLPIACVCDLSAMFYSLPCEI